MTFEEYFDKLKAYLESNSIGYKVKNGNIVVDHSHISREQMDAINEIIDEYLKGKI